ncbi:U3 small nucleolar RNA-associated protein 7 [Pyrus ussuriensis x Pyrus communis]|uniref:U3 small nucleolar RNA-associated protein 7 n=1 Tax=Pyrus ussuriensis x Pyrus communis TaxID=2448454 RepID=A0A5N5F0L6_9ROSA|nr:U3 small nucleolar RNA-associated protein 7 [Pyrus ussuriensis x Pyrus communis]
MGKKVVVAVVVGDVPPGMGRWRWFEREDERITEVLSGWGQLAKRRRNPTLERSGSGLGRSERMIFETLSSRQALWVNKLVKVVIGRQSDRVEENRISAEQNEKKVRRKRGGGGGIGEGERGWLSAFVKT